MASGSVSKSVLRVSRLLRDARLVQDLNGGRRAEVRPVLKHPDDFLVRRDFDELGSLSFGSTGTNDGVAVRQTGGALRVDIAVSLRQVARSKFPNRLLPGVDLARENVFFVRDQSVAVLEANSGPGRWNFIAPDFLEILVVLDNLAHLQERNQVGSPRGVARPAELGVDRRFAGQAGRGQIMLNLDRVGL